MSVVITGATGHLGRLVVESLLQQDFPARDITAAGRDTTKIKDLADRGVRVRAIDYDDPATLDGAFRGAARILLISASQTGQRARQHGNAIDAARRAGPACWPTPASSTPTPPPCAWPRSIRPPRRRCAPPAWSTCCCATAGTPRSYTAQIPAILQRGSLTGSADDGRVSAATRADYAAAAAAVLAGDGHAGRVYELGGDQAFTLTEFAAEISAQAGQPVSYHDLPMAEYAQLLISAGLPESAAAIIADADRGLARGDLYVDSGHLRQLIGRPTTSLHDAVAAALH